MATPNTQLEAALAQFAAQPGTTPDQEAQLRAAVTTDTNRLALLNQQAAAGQLNGFALETPSGAPNLTGTYDKATGVVSIPAASFQPGGTAAGADLEAVVGLQSITVDFAHKTWQDPAGQTQIVNQDMVTNLQATLNRSPVLAAQIKDAVTQGHVQHFSLLGNSMAAGATYDGSTVQQDGTPKGINLPPLGLQTNTSANPHGKYDARDMTFVLGHEIQHGINDAAKDQATRTFMESINTQAHVQGPVHDYTDDLLAYIQAGRQDEAKAEIADWNALLSREQQNNPSVTLDEMRKLPIGRQHDFLELDYTSHPPLTVPRPGLTFNQDNSLSQTLPNVTAMGQHYFDRPSPVYAQSGQRPVGLGEHKPNPTADYTNFYGTWALERIIAAEDHANVQYQGTKPQIAINMAGLGLKEDLIEMEGLDLGANKTPRPYLNTSQTPAVPGQFHHTQDGSMGHDHQHVPISQTPTTSNRHSDPLVEQAVAALKANDEPGARAASLAFATPDRWHQTVADAEQRMLAKQQQLPGRDNPLFEQAITHLERLGPQAGGYLDRVQMESVAGAIAYQAKLHHLPSIDALTPVRDGQSLLATSTNPNNPSQIHSALIDKSLAATQPLEQSLQQLTTEAQRHQEQALLQSQPRQIETQQMGLSH